QLTGGDSAILQPRLEQAEHFTSSDGAEAIATNEPLRGRMLRQIAQGGSVAFEPVNLAGVTELRFRVAAGETGGTIEVRTGSVDGPVLATVDVESGGDGQRFRTHTVEVSDPGGSHELFLVFTDTPGAESLFSLDWVRFS